MWLSKHLVTSYLVKVIRVYEVRNGKEKSGLGGVIIYHGNFRQKRKLIKGHFSSGTNRKKNSKIGKVSNSPGIAWKMAVLHSKWQNSAVFQDIGVKFSVLFVNKWSSTYVIFENSNIFFLYFGKYMGIIFSRFMIFIKYEIIVW